MAFYKPTIYGRLTDTGGPHGTSTAVRRSPDEEDGAAAFRWRGLVVARAWPADVDEDDIALMRVNGLRWRLAHARDFGTAVELDGRDAAEGRRLLDRHALDVREFKNVACNAGRNNLFNFIASTAYTSVNNQATGIVALAVGTTAGTPASGDSQLFNEVFRKALTTTVISTNQIDLNCNFAANEANYQFEDVGIFGSAASGTSGAASGGAVASTSVVNTGILYAHANYVYNKTNTITLSNDYYVTLT